MSQEVHASARGADRRGADRRQRREETPLCISVMLRPERVFAPLCLELHTPPRSAPLAFLRLIVVVVRRSFLIAGTSSHPNTSLGDTALARRFNTNTNTCRHDQYPNDERPYGTVRYVYIIDGARSLGPAFALISPRHLVSSAFRPDSSRTILPPGHPNPRNPAQTHSLRRLGRSCTSDHSCRRRRRRRRSYYIYTSSIDG